MKKNLIAIDLGTTNIKVCVYDNQLNELGVFSENVTYNTNGDFVEFDADQYFLSIASMIRQAGVLGMSINKQTVSQICLTGQAESFVMLGNDFSPVHPGISWMDMRSRRECAELANAFDPKECYSITGQPELIPTWPITKILWMKRHKPEIFNSVSKYLLLKDYIVFRLCGRPLGDQSIYGFSHYFNVADKCYWTDILSYVGIKEDQLPETAPSGTIAGTLLKELIDVSIGLDEDTKINIGTLDHFSSMIGTGNVGEGLVNESAGTVLSLATITKAGIPQEGTLPFYCGPFPNTYAILPVCESGGYCLEWYKKNFMPDKSFNQITEGIIERGEIVPPVFLPYLTGTNAPDFNENASGVFFGIRSYHTPFDFSRGIMEGVACLLKVNLDYMEQSGMKIDRIISTGGGAKSEFWTQIKADMTQKKIDIPKNTEAACLGAAIMAAVSEGYFKSYEDAAAHSISIEKRYYPQKNTRYEETFRLFTKLYNDLKEVYKDGAKFYQATE